MKITASVRYVLRDGLITGALEGYEHSTYLFKDGSSIYTKTGKGGAGHGPSKYDIVAKYHANRPTIIRQE